MFRIAKKSKRERGHNYYDIPVQAREICGSMCGCEAGKGDER